MTDKTTTYDKTVLDLDCAKYQKLMQTAISSLQTASEMLVGITGMGHHESRVGKQSVSVEQAMDSSMKLVAKLTKSESKKPDEIERLRKRIENDQKRLAKLKDEK